MKNMDIKKYDKIISSGFRVFNTGIDPGTDQYRISKLGLRQASEHIKLVYPTIIPETLLLLCL